MPRGSQTRTSKRGANKNRRVTTEKSEPERQTPPVKPIVTGPSGQKSYGEVVAQKMNESERGRLYNASGNRVTRPNQALNIARREARMAGARNVPLEGKAERTKRAQAKSKRAA